MIRVFFVLSPFLVYSIVSLQCYEGSKGIVNGVPSSSFVVKECEEDMTHCFKSFDNNHSDETASCQTMSTSANMLKICDVGCVNHTDIDVTICCCSTNLCNIPDDIVPTAMPNTEAPSETDKIDNKKYRLAKNLS